MSQTQDIQFGDDRMAERYWAKVLANPETGCWEFRGGLGGSGYARIYVDGIVVPGHRYFYQVLVGGIPDGLQLDHLCRVPKCVNPRHLEPVTSAENTRRGNVTKLTRERVAEIKVKLSHGQQSQAEIANDFGVSQNAVANIAQGKTWADVEPIEIPGRRRPRVVLSMEVAEQIRATPEISGSEWARRLGVNQQTISKIRTGKTWKA